MSKEKEKQKESKAVCNVEEFYEQSLLLFVLIFLTTPKRESSFACVSLDEKATKMLKEWGGGRL